MKNQAFTIISIYAAMFVVLMTPLATATDFYWKGGSGTSDNIDENGNWWDGSAHPSAGDNLYFDNTSGSRHWPYNNYGVNDRWFGYIITYNGAGGIKWRGEETEAIKWENNNDGNLFEIEANIRNRDTLDMEINPVGSGGIKITGNINMRNNDKWLKVYGSQTLEITGVISGNSGVDMTIYDTPTVILSGANTWPDELNIYGGIVDLRNADPLGVSMINLGEGSGTQSATVRLGADGIDVDNDITIVSGSTGTKTLNNNYAGTNEISGNIFMDDNATISTIAGSTLELNGFLYATNKTLTLTGSGTVLISGANYSKYISDDSATTGFDIQGGTLKTSLSGSLGRIYNLVSDYIKLGNGAVFNPAVINNKFMGIELQAGGGKIYVDDLETLAYGGDISGAHKFTKLGPGVLKLSSASAFTAATEIYIDAGELWVTDFGLCYKDEIERLTVAEESHINADPALEMIHHFMIQEIPIS